MVRLTVRVAIIDICLCSCNQLHIWLGGESPAYHVYLSLPLLKVSHKTLPEVERTQKLTL